VSGVTSRPSLSGLGSSRVKAASTARPAQSSLGLGCWRRSTASSWRNTSSSASFDADDRASIAIHPTRPTNIRYSIRTVTNPRSCHPGHHHGWHNRRSATYPRFWNPTPPLAPTGRRAGRIPAAVTADRGYGQPAVERDLRGVGERIVAIPRQAKTSPARKAAEHGRGFPRLVKWRTGSEGRISYLTRGYGWDRTAWIAGTEPRSGAGTAPRLQHGQDRGPGQLTSQGQSRHPKARTAVWPDPGPQGEAFENVNVTSTFAACLDRFDAMTVHFPPRSPGNSGNRSKQVFWEPRRLHTPCSRVETRMLNVAPYQVRAFTLTLADAGAATVTLKEYCAGGGAVIGERADECPAGSTNRAACRCSAAVSVRVVFLACSCVRLLPLLFPAVHAFVASTKMLQAAITVKRLAIPHSSDMETDATIASVA